MKNIYILFLLSLIATGCVAYLPEELLLPVNDISISVKGEEIMKFEENSCQLGYNDRNNEFRVFNDKLTNWFILRCDATPTSVKQKIIADLEYTTSDDLKTLTDLVFTVEKIDENGWVWLWEFERKIGLVIKLL